MEKMLGLALKASRPARQKAQKKARLKQAPWSQQARQRPRARMGETFVDAAGGGAGVVKMDVLLAASVEEIAERAAASREPANPVASAATETAGIETAVSVLGVLSRAVGRSSGISVRVQPGGWDAITITVRLPATSPSFFPASRSRSISGRHRRQHRSRKQSKNRL